MDQGVGAPGTEETHVVHLTLPAKFSKLTHGRRHYCARQGTFRRFGYLAPKSAPRLDRQTLQRVVEKEIGAEPRRNRA
jgi:hypothetical protein